jgi:hypothetical protein
MELEVGQFVRTKKGSIAKILGIDWLFDGDGNELSNIEAIYFDNVIDKVDKDIYTGCAYLLKDCKSSFNIRDLIEEGDYVNGNYVIQISKEFNCLFIETTYYDELQGEDKHNFIKEKDIKFIVTKEQFESMEYKIGGE